MRVVRLAKDSWSGFRSSGGGQPASRRRGARCSTSRLSVARFSTSTLLLALLAARAPNVHAQRVDRAAIQLAGPVEKTPGPPSPEGAGRADQEAALEINPAELAGSKRAQAAHALLKAIHTGRAESADRHRRFLVEILSPVALSEGPWVSAASIVQELQSWIPREGLPYPELAADLLPLIGVGPQEFRKIVIQTVNVLVAHENESGQGSPTLEALKEKLARRALKESVLRDAVAVLWRNDPRAALASLVAALEFYSGDEADEPMMWACLEELRTRVSVYFPTPELWQKWWDRVERLPLEEILVEYQRTLTADFTNNWRRLIELLKDTQDEERVLAAIRDTLQQDSIDLRLAAVNALGGYAQWVLETPLRPDQSKDDKAPYLKRGAETLLAVIERQQFPLESPDVIQAAMASLRMYQGLSEAAPEVHKRLSENVVKRLERFSREDCSEAGIYLETVRVAGALQVTDALPHIERYLTRTVSRACGKLEFVSSAVLALGRLVDGAGMSGEMAELLIQLFQQPLAGSEKEVQELRLACMIALERGAGNPEIRRRLLDFYRRVLVEHQDAVLPVRAILGLGTLVKAREADALQTMVEILEKRKYSLDAVLAVVDSIASYVSPPEALHRFLPVIVTQDAAIRSRLWSKVVGLVEAGGLSNAALASRELLMLGVERDNPLYFEAAENLFAEASLRALLDPQKLDLASRRQVAPWWNIMLHLARAHDLRRQHGAGGEEDLALAKVAILREVLLKNEALRNELPEDVAEFESIAAAFKKRADLLPGLAAADGRDPARLVEEFAALLAAEPSAVARRSHLLWIERQLGAIKSAERLSSLRDAWLGFLGAESNAGLWEGLPEAYRTRYLSRLKDLQAASPPAPPPAPGSPPPEKPEKESEG